MSNRFLIILGVIILGLGGLYVATRPKTPAANSNIKAEASNHIAGKGTSGVTLVEYGDYQCPACGAYYPIVKQVQQKYGDQIKFQFRNYPLTQIHQNAFAGARAAEAAGLQNKYWEMHDLLYENQTAWSNLSSPNTAFEAYAQQLGLDLNKFKTDFSSTLVNGIINADMQAGNAYEITGTPTFVLDGTKIENSPRDVDGFAKLIDAEIAKKKPSRGEM